MRSDILQCLRCPACACEIAADGESLQCVQGHSYPVVGGVPRMFASSEGEVIRRSFSFEWAQFDYDADRTWGFTPAERVETFLSQVQMSADQLKGKIVLDAGCGNAILANAITTLECDVVGVDVSDSVFSARRRFESNDSLHLVQANLMEPVFREQSFDVIYSGGVLHHTPDTRKALEQVLRALAPGGRIFVWLYWRVPGRSYQLRGAIRRAMSPLPLRLKQVLVTPLGAASALRHRGRDDLTWRERFVIELDYYTPKYRWEHTPDEVTEWFGSMGMTNVVCTDEGRDGFGVMAVAPS